MRKKTTGNGIRGNGGADRMKRKLEKRIGNEWCEVEIELEDNRLSVCGAYGEVVSLKKARKQALEYWKGFFDESPTERMQMNEKHGCNCRTSTGAARYVLHADGELHGLDVHRRTEGEVFIVQDCGQCWDEMKRFFPQLEPLEKWHLNDTKAGTMEQHAFLEQHKAERPNGVDWYTWACDALKAAGLYIVDASRYITAANVPASKEYAYGSQWLRHDLPEEIKQLAETIYL